ncbi:hypothetical protein QYE76_066912 [Lolium multiflorum]|uniref:Transposase (putative) gypsy type domain-containing protein n=1 Tax=Lolium multiflorum TaxID=4521 RepID=A0AAD8SDM2_LOLMU|nr:hypothetical protein QYE76_066912 [Lolium multiflorum]
MGGRSSTPRASLPPFAPLPSSSTTEEMRGRRCRSRSQGERVVFISHFERGFGLPASPFFCAFLDFFGLQPHHLPANACVTLSCYVAFCEGYASL